MTVFIDGIATRYYRGIGSETQFIAPFSRLNFFIGANNSGKSVILTALDTHLKNSAESKQLTTPNGPETFKGQKSGQFQFFLGTSSKHVAEKVISQNADRLKEFQRHANNPLKGTLIDICRKLSEDELIWNERTSGSRKIELSQEDIEKYKRWTSDWKILWQAITRSSGGDYRVWISQVVEYIINCAIPRIPEVHLIPAKRQLGPRGDELTDMSGRGLIDHLASLQNPSWDKQEDREKFKRINIFLRAATGKPDATLEIANQREHLLVHIDNKVLPLENLGTGIHEVVLIAAFCTIHDYSIMCIEEPEIHLHPLLQRKLIDHLIKNTRSQYFIATHSSAFIDTPDANIFHVSNDGTQTYVRPALTKDSQRDILDELGFLASDLLQTNAVIWVEGPSDRIYLNHWINEFDPNLKEGTHYTIMFYGGALISHLTASDEALKEFIHLRDLNRHMAIILDSDRDEPDAPLKDHAQRIFDEMSVGKGMVWITAGREVENYLDPGSLQAALRKLHSNIYDEPYETGQFDHAFYFRRKLREGEKSRETYKKGDKVGAARIICNQKADLDRLDLRERIEELVALVREANG